MGRKGSTENDTGSISDCLRKKKREGDNREILIALRPDMPSVIVCMHCIDCRGTMHHLPFPPGAQDDDETIGRTQ